ncbi:hypothetical protein OA57_08765 [Chelonobacter oris]|uniref:Uncharacterized protein n=1 Tax=Chelonobacter oris TaxID=505317 RepID=A0A0A3ARN9_9PAST|nr:hypothetical protein OA57_08765 [Chelonobacter oris]
MKRCVSFRLLALTSRALFVTQFSKNFVVLALDAQMVGTEWQYALIPAKYHGRIEDLFALLPPKHPQPILVY